VVQRAVVHVTETKDEKGETVQTETSTGELCPVEIYPNEWMLLSVLIKRDNRRKHNSHYWFLHEAGFASAYNSDFVFLTDCGTLYDRHCLFHLFLALWTHPSWTAVSGRPRVMSAEQQGSHGESFWSRGWRAAQRFDFEASTSSFTAAFALGGMLPVIPGPCGLYRFAAIKGEAAPYYLNELNQNPDTIGMLKASLLLAEDRVLSYAAVLLSKETNAATSFVPAAIFYFEAETDTERLFTQRRRWINGTIAGYIWLIQNIGMVFNSKLPLFQKAFLTILITSQLLMYCVVVLSPSFIALGLNYSLQSFVWGGDLGSVRVPHVPDAAFLSRRCVCVNRLGS
jgi:cellulose synthase/poly-beta-1,6-N-acetylglucosamine synthase-like glycosyltransferase